MKKVSKTNKANKTKKIKKIKKIKKSKKAVKFDMSAFVMPLLNTFNYAGLGQKLITVEPLPPAPGITAYLDAQYGKKGNNGKKGKIELANGSTITTSNNIPTFEVALNPKIHCPLNSEILKAMGYDVLEEF